MSAKESGFLKELFRSAEYPKEKIIELTDYTCKFGDHVFQTSNISGFSSFTRKFPFKTLIILEALVYAAYKIHMASRVILPYIFGRGYVTFQVTSDTVTFGYLFAGSIILCFILHTYYLTWQGLRISLNSGENFYFVHEDKDFIHKIVNKIYKAMNRETKFGKIIINLEDKSVNIDRSVNINGNSQGDIITGDNTKKSTVTHQVSASSARAEDVSTNRHRPRPNDPASPTKLQRPPAGRPKSSGDSDKAA